MWCERRQVTVWPMMMLGYCDRVWVSHWMLYVGCFPWVPCWVWYRDPGKLVDPPEWIREVLGE